MGPIAVADGVEYALLEPADAGAMARLLAEAFSRFEPMGVAIEIPCEQVERLVAAFVPKALAERLTIVARNVSDRSLVGALLADDFGTIPPQGLEEAAPRFAPIGALLEGLDEQYRTQNHVVPGTHAHLFMLGVAEHARSRGIAGRLVEASIASARLAGYSVAVTEATGSISQHVFRKHGFKDLFGTSYKAFRFDGQDVFSSIEGVDGTILMTLTLGRPSHVRPTPSGQGRPRVTRGRCRSCHALRARGARAGGAQPPEHRRAVRHGRGRRPPLLHPTWRAFDIFPDGTFAMKLRAEPADGETEDDIYLRLHGITELHVIVNWIEEVRRRLPR